ncbi:hypothetical protein [Pseudovibrio axinellae]|uniref:hypothetical protein n=1 Tax=Pseudovibrio axinellae TaxID=989403 RepID=UPI003CC7A1B5
MSACCLEYTGLPEKLRHVSDELMERRLSVFCQRPEVAKENGEIAQDTSVVAMAGFLSGQTLAITGRARAGAEMDRLSDFIQVALTVFDKHNTVSDP